MEKDDVDDFQDRTVPNLSEITEHCGNILEEFNQVSLTYEITISSIPSYEPPQKPEKRKKLVADDYLSVENVKLFISTGTLKKFTVAELTEILKNAGAKPNGKKKGDLLDQVQQLYE